MKYFITALLLFGIIAARAQQQKVLKFRTIIGTVVDKDGKPSADWNITFANLPMGAPSDVNGNFTIYFPNEPVMLFIYNNRYSRSYYVKVSPELQSLNIKIDKTLSNTSKRDSDDWERNKADYIARTKLALQSDEFYEYIHHGQKPNANVKIEENVVAQSYDQRVEAPDSNYIYNAPLQIAKFGTTSTDWQNYLQGHLKYPAQAKKDGIQGKVLVSFVVERDGRLSNIKVIRTLSPECDQEAIRIVKSSPLWVPAHNHEKIVREQYSSDVNFNL